MTQGVYWLLTIPHHQFIPYLPPDISYIKGQLEQGEGGYIHWQILAICQRSRRLNFIKNIFGDQCHAELSRSNAADDYVWKEDTRIENTQFELGKRTIRRNKQTDWDSIRQLACNGEYTFIPSDIYIRCYNQLRRITQDNLQPHPVEKEVYVYWGLTGVGKSHKAWEEATFDAYPKDPRTKFWDGYKKHINVVIDEFRGSIDIAHMLRWLDKYPVIIETKGSSTVLCAQKIWITSNLHPNDWYPDLDIETKQALLRRLHITHMLNNQLQ